MSLLGLLRAYAQTRTYQLILTVVRKRRHHRTIRHGAVDETTLRKARETWWGHDSRWYPGGTPPRLHNRVTAMIDGDNYFRALQGDLAQAKGYVFIAGWCLTPNIPLERSSPEALLQSRLLDVLSETAGRVPVRILLWGGSPMFLKPDRTMMEGVAETFRVSKKGDIRCALDRTARPSHTHHQKGIVIDGQTAYVGGMDLTTYLGDRWDTRAHSLRAGINWHDVQVRIEGEAVADVESNFRERWQEVTEDTALPQREPDFEASWQTPVQIVRTIPHSTYRFARRGEFGIYHAYIEAIRRAKRFIYLENQYLWSPHIVDALADAMSTRRSEPFRVVIVLPAQAEDGKLDNDKHVAELRALDDGRGIVSVYSLYASGPNIGRLSFTARPIYVHAKVAVFDDEWLAVGSANLNNRGLITDSEMDALINDPDLARSLRVDLWAEHLAKPRNEVALADPIWSIDQEWPACAERNAEIVKESNRPFPCAVHRYEVGRVPGTWLIEEAEDLTLEL